MSAPGPAQAAPTRRAARSEMTLLPRPPGVNQPRSERACQQRVRRAVLQWQLEVLGVVEELRELRPKRRATR